MKYLPNFNQSSAVLKKLSELKLPCNQPITVASLCDVSGIKYRVSGGVRADIYIDDESLINIRSLMPDGKPIYVIGTYGITKDENERLIRILEILAYAFHDYAAKESLISARVFARFEK